MEKEQWWNVTDRGNKEVLLQKPVPVLLRPPQIPNGHAREREAALFLNYGTVAVIASLNKIGPSYTVAGHKLNLSFDLWI